jgi:hypothetical protein
MSRTAKHGKAGARRRPELRPRTPDQSGALCQRRQYGSTEKILRRNRKLWTRLYAKIGRRHDKQVVQEGLDP